MAIDGDIYNRGVHGELSFDEINSLPNDYAMLKQFFHNANELKNKRQ